MKGLCVKRKIVVVLISLILALNLGVNGNIQTEETNNINQAPTGVIKVVTSMSLLADWASEIGGELFSPVSIVSGNEDPHSFDLGSTDYVTIGAADLFLYLGFESVEPWVENALDSVNPANSEAIASEDMIETDPLTGDLNPHIWMSPIIVKSLVDNMTDAIIAVDPSNQAQYELNRDSYLSELDDLILELETTYYDLFNGTKIIVHHPSFLYLLDIIGIVRSGVIEEVEGVEPSAFHVQKIIDKMIEENISLIITQPQIEEDQVIQIARDTKAKLAKLTPLLGIEGAETYIKMILFNMNALQNPEDVPPSNMTTIMIIVGASVLGVTLIAFVYLRFIRK